jgi:hypothetical protein
MQALDVLEQAANSSSPEQQKLQQSCLAGLARTLLHLGDLQGGRALAQQLDSSALWKECATILEQRHQMQEAAELYERAGLTEKAAGIHIAARNWAAVAPLVARVSSAKLQLAYARGKEGEGSWAEAAAAYEAAGGTATVVAIAVAVPAARTSTPHRPRLCCCHPLCCRRPGCGCSVEPQQAWQPDPGCCARPQVTQCQRCVARGEGCPGGRCVVGSLLA